MSKQDVLIEQPAGLGDIMFCQKIAHRLDQENKFRDIYWPVSPYFSKDVERINSPAKFIHPGDDELRWRLDEESISGKDEFLRVPLKNAEGAHKVPLQRADQIVPKVTSLLTCKYEMVGLDWTDWADYFEFRRDFDRENDLFAHLKLDPDSKYMVVGNSCGSPPNQKMFMVPRTDDCKRLSEEYPRTISIDMIDGFSVFDWCGILESASAIHMVDTCFVYIMEKLRLKTNHLHLYSRYHPEDFSHIQKLLNVKWEYEEW